MMVLECVQAFFKSRSLTRLGDVPKLMIRSMESINKTREISLSTGCKMPLYAFLVSTCWNKLMGNGFSIENPIIYAHPTLFNY